MVQMVAEVALVPVRYGVGESGEKNLTEVGVKMAWQLVPRRGAMARRSYARRSSGTRLKREEIGGKVMVPPEEAVRGVPSAWETVTGERGWSWQRWAMEGKVD